MACPRNALAPESGAVYGCSGRASRRLSSARVTPLPPADHPTDQDPRPTRSPPPKRPSSPRHRSAPSGRSPSPDPPPTSGPSSPVPARWAGAARSPATASNRRGGSQPPLSRGGSSSTAGRPSASGLVTRAGTRRRPSASASRGGSQASRRRRRRTRPRVHTAGPTERCRRAPCVHSSSATAFASAPTVTGNQAGRVSRDNPAELEAASSSPPSSRPDD